MLHGLITELNLPEIEEEFPGIWAFYLDLEEKPCTFLELVWRFGARDCCDSTVTMACAGARRMTLR